MKTTVITTAYDLATLVDQINSARWDEANDICEYDVESLRKYLANEDTIFIACHDIGEKAAALLGIASAQVLPKPYAGQLWLYVDEVDVCVGQRRKGAGKAMMEKLLQIAEERDCEELWLGTEIDNIPANALYNSISPSEVEQFVGFNYEIGKQDA